MKQDALTVPLNTAPSVFWSCGPPVPSAAWPGLTARVKAIGPSTKSRNCTVMSAKARTHAVVWKRKVKHRAVLLPVNVLVCRSVMNSLCLPDTVPVPEEHQDFPGGVRRRIRHEEKRALRGL